MWEKIKIILLYLLVPFVYIFSVNTRIVYHKKWQALILVYKRLCRVSAVCRGPSAAVRGCYEGHVTRGL
jgi:hypothetical protein